MQSPQAWLGPLQVTQPITTFLRTIPILRQQPGTRWVGSEKWQFLLTFSTIYADVGWVSGSEIVQKYADVI